MVLLSQQEFDKMEQLLAGLLSETNPAEEAALLALHLRLQNIFAAQSNLHLSREYLKGLQSRTER